MVLWNIILLNTILSKVRMSKLIEETERLLQKLNINIF